MEPGDKVNGKSERRPKEERSRTFNKEHAQLSKLTLPSSWTSDEQQFLIHLPV